MVFLGVADRLKALGFCPLSIGHYQLYVLDLSP